MTSTGSASPPLFLHIGHGKAGSTTIQSLAKEHSKFMEAAGIFCPLTLQGMSNHMRLAWALSDPESDRPTLRQFRKDLAGTRNRKVFVSSEGLLSISDAGIRRLKRIVHDRELRILFYLRDYPSRQPSLYAEHNKRALKTRDFDDYFSRLTYERVSVLPRLEKWAAAFGWHTLRVRTLDSSVLAGGDLVRDVLHALEVEMSPPKVSRMNERPHWITLECQRALAAAAECAGLGELDTTSRQVSRQLFDTCAATVRPRRVQYLTRAQWRQLADWYRRDIAVLGDRMGMSFPAALEEPAERPFLPSLDAVPNAVKADIARRLRKPPFAGMRPEVVALIERLVRDGQAAATATGPEAFWTKLMPRFR